MMTPALARMAASTSSRSNVKSTPITSPSRCHNSTHALRPTSAEEHCPTKSPPISGSSTQAGRPTPKRRATRSKSSPTSSNGPMSRANKPNPTCPAVGGAATQWTTATLSPTSDCSCESKAVYAYHGATFDRDVPDCVVHLVRRRQRTRRPVRWNRRTRRRRGVLGDELGELRPGLVDVDVRLRPDDPGPDGRPSRRRPPRRRRASPKRRLSSAPTDLHQPLSDTQRSPCPRSGDADRVDPVANLEVNDRGFGQGADSARRREGRSRGSRGRPAARPHECPAVRVGSTHWRVTDRRRHTPAERPRGR